MEGDISAKKSFQYEGIHINEKGEVTALFSYPDWGDKLGVLTEVEAHRMYLKAYAHKQLLPPHIQNEAGGVNERINEYQKGRAVIQAYKMHPWHNMPLDTPICFHEEVPETTTTPIPELH